MESTSAQTKREPKIWGKGEAEFYGGLRDQMVQITCLDNLAYKGRLIGLDQFNIILAQESGLELLIPKHAIKMAHKATNGAATVKGKA